MWCREHGRSTTRSTLLHPAVSRAGVADRCIIIRPSSVVVSLRWTMLNDTAKSTSRKSVARQIDTATVRVRVRRPPTAFFSFSSVFAAARRRTRPPVRPRSGPAWPAAARIDLYQADADYTAAEWADDDDDVDDVDNQTIYYCCRSVADIESNSNRCPTYSGIDRRAGGRQGSAARSSCPARRAAVVDRLPPTQRCLSLLVLGAYRDTSGSSV